MDSRKAAYFLALIDEGSFTAAARVLHLSQPALSAAIKDLENELGTALVERLGRSVIPTSAGQALEPHARRAVAELRAGEATVAAVLGLQAGTLRTSCLPTLATDPMAGAVGALRQRFPAIKVDILGPENSQELVAQLRTGRCEIGLASEGIRSMDLMVAPAGTQQLTWILPPGSRCSADPQLEELATHPIVTFPRGASMRTVLDQAFEEAGLEPTVAVEVAARDAVIPLVLSGAGIALVPEPVAQVAEARGARRASVHHHLSRQLVVLHRASPLSPAAACLKALLCSSVPEGTTEA